MVHGPAVNSRLRNVVEYGPDPRGWAVFRRLSGMLQRAHTGRGATRVVDTQRRFTGLADVGQRMTGMAPLGKGRPVVPANSELSDERAAGVLDDGALRIFAERLRRGR